MLKTFTLMKVKWLLFITILPLLGTAFTLCRIAGFAATVSAPQPIRIPVVKAVAPRYPLLFLTREIGEKELVVVSAQVNELGNVVSANAINGQPVLLSAAEKAARQWRFEPSLNGEKVRTTEISFVFRIMPPNTADEELITVFLAPNHIEVRSPFFKVTKNDHR